MISHNPNAELQNVDTCTSLEIQIAMESYSINFSLKIVACSYTAETVYTNIKRGSKRKPIEVLNFIEANM